MTFFQTLRLILSLTRRELRDGVAGFKIFLVSLLLGVGTIALVGAFNADIRTSIQQEARNLLGADLVAERIHQRADASLRAQWAAWTEKDPFASEEVAPPVSPARFAEMATMRSLAYRLDRQHKVLIDLKAVTPSAYPLAGALVYTPAEAALPELLGPDATGLYGVVVEASLLDLLDLNLGDQIRIGTAAYRLVARLEQEPDRTISALGGPRVLMSLDGLEHAGLIQFGSLIDWRYLFLLDEDPARAEAGLPEFHAFAKPVFEAAGFFTRTVHDTAQDNANLFGRLGFFLILSGLSALLVGGVGIGNAVRGYLVSRVRTYALWKCLGAPPWLVVTVAFVQILLRAFLGIGLGLLVGVGLYLGLVDLLARLLPLPIRGQVSARPLLEAALFGVVMTLLFALPPLLSLADVRGSLLLRGGFEPLRSRFKQAFFLMLVPYSGLVALVFMIAPRASLALTFMALGTGGLGLLVLCERFGVRALSRFRPRRLPMLRMVLAGLRGREQSRTGLFLSLSIGLAVLTTLGQVRSNLTAFFSEQRDVETPSYFFVDIQQDQLDAFVALVEAEASPDHRLDVTPMIRGRITKAGTKPVETFELTDDHRWLIEGDRGFTWSQTPPRAGSEITEGSWWPSQPAPSRQLVSVGRLITEAFDLTLGDSISVDILGREVTAEIANIRDISWRGFGMNFLFIFSPGVVDLIPAPFLAVLYDTEPESGRVAEQVSRQFGNISYIQLEEVLLRIRALVERLDLALSLVASVALFSGFLVLAGAVAAQQRQRAYEVVLCKVVGATPRDLLKLQWLEFLIIGLIASFGATLFGLIASWVLLRFQLQLDFSLSYRTFGWVTGLGILVAFSVGWLESFYRLRQRPLVWLRNL